MVAPVSAAAGEGELNADLSVLNHLERVAEVSCHTPLRGERVQFPEVALGRKAPLVGKTHSGGVDGGC